MKFQLGDARIFHFLKCVVEFRFELLMDIPGSIDGHVRVLLEIESADVIESGNVVLVTVREQDGIQPLYSFPEHLLTEVGTRIDHEAFAINVEVNRASKPLVTVIHRPAHFTFAPDDGHTLGRAGAKKCDFQVDC